MAALVSDDEQARSTTNEEDRTMRSKPPCASGRRCARQQRLFVPDQTFGVSRRSAIQTLGGGLIAGAALCSLGLTPSRADSEVVKRSLAELLAAQSSTSDFDPPFPDYNGWSTPLSDPARFAYMDYGGALAKYLIDNEGIDLGTKVHGAVTQRELQDDQAEVTVILHTTNALIWIVNLDGDLVTDPLDFGYRPAEIIANPSLDPSLGECHFKFVFTIPTPETPLPDMTLVLIGETGTLLSYDFRAEATGTLRTASGFPEGTPGTARVANTAVTLDNPFCGDECFPLEFIVLKAANNASNAAAQGSAALQADADRSHANPKRKRRRSRRKNRRGR
jgi:hypothetical protein